MTVRVFVVEHQPHGVSLSSCWPIAESSRAKPRRGEEGIWRGWVDGLARWWQEETRRFDIWRGGHKQRLRSKRRRHIGIQVAGFADRESFVGCFFVPASIWRLALEGVS